MNIDEIAICVGEPDFEYDQVRWLKVKCEASNALMPAPTIDEANGRLRALAAKEGATDIIRVTYDSGISFTSWKSLRAEGLAVRRRSDERDCPVCAEKIKKAALKCRYCGSAVDPANVVESEVQEEVAKPESPAPARVDAATDNNNPAIIIGLIAIGLTIFFAVLAAASHQ